jgi:hypothetical protein
MMLKTRRKKNVKKGIQFCLMVCGASGTGRTTFVNTLCGTQVLQHKESDDPTTAHIEEGVKIQPVTVELEEEGVRILLTVVDTPGFGDQIDNEARSATPLLFLPLPLPLLLPWPLADCLCLQLFRDRRLPRARVRRHTRRGIAHQA